MKTSLVRSFFLVLALLIGAIPGMSVAHQAESDDLPDTILNIEADENWEFIMGNGLFEPMAYAQYVDGSAPAGLFSATEQYYEDHEVESVYISSTNLMPANTEYDAVGTYIETRVLQFSDSDNAASYLAGIHELAIQEDADDEDLDWQVELIDPLPKFDYPITGWTMHDLYWDELLEPQGNVSAVRFMAQIDSVLVSGMAMGPFVDFNFDAALGVLEHQASCVTESDPCAPVTFTDVVSGWTVMDGELVFDDGATRLKPARWVYPVDEPVRTPDVSHRMSHPSSSVAFRS